jgi:hypothetical protein
MIRKSLAVLLAVLVVFGVGATMSVVVESPALADGCSGGGFWPFGGGSRCVWTQPDGTVIWCDSGGGMGIWVSNNCYPAPPP